MASHHTDSHGLFLLSRRYLFVTKIFLLSHGESRMIYLSRISELSNYSSHGESRMVTEDFYGMRPLLWTYCTTGRNLRINTHTDGHGESFCPEFANLRIFLHTENCGRSRRISMALDLYSGHTEQREGICELIPANLKYGTTIPITTA